MKFLRMHGIALLMLAAFGSGCTAISAHREAMARKASSEDDCGAYETPTGSHIRRHVCRSQSQREADARDSQSSLQELERMGSQTTSPMSSGQQTGR